MREEEGEAPRLSGCRPRGRGRGLPKVLYAPLPAMSLQHPRTRPQPLQHSHTSKPRSAPKAWPSHRLHSPAPRGGPGRGAPPAG